MHCTIYLFVAVTATYAYAYIAAVFLYIYIYNIYIYIYPQPCLQARDGVRCSNYRTSMLELLPLENVPPDFLSQFGTPPEFSGTPSDTLTEVPPREVDYRR